MRVSLHSLAQDLPESLRSVETRPLFVLREQVPPLIVVGRTPNAFRRIGLVQGGSFVGERLSGEVVSGNDWQDVRADSCIRLDVRLVLKTTDGALIVMTYQCLRAGPPEIIEKLDRGEAVDPRSYYFRMNPMFETSTPEYDWMNRIISVGVGHRLADGPLSASSKFSDFGRYISERRGGQRGHLDRETLQEVAPAWYVAAGGARAFSFLRNRHRARRCSR